LFDTYEDAENYADAEMYPPEVHGLIPEVRGSFADVRIDQLQIYVPAKVLESEEA
jgi:hypothetical protein